jgi:hypothetical protein
MSIKQMAIPFLILLFFFLFATNARAYQIFTANPYFNDTNGVLPYGAILYNPLYNDTWYFNDTCTIGNKCLIVENNGTNQLNSLWFQGRDWLYTGLSPQWSNLTALLEFNSQNEQDGIPYIYTLLPANEEGLLVFNYRWNNTLTTPAPYILVQDSNGNQVMLFYLNSTANVTYNVSKIINATSSERYLAFRLSWYWDNLPTNLEMDKFKFYSYDIIEARSEGLTSNATYEVERYCGSGYSWKCTDYAHQGFLVNESRNNGFIYANGEDGYSCIVFKIGDQIIGRRVISTDQSPFQGMPLMSWTRDPMYFFEYFAGGTCAGILTMPAPRFLVESITLNSMKITVFDNATLAVSGNISYNDLHATNIDMMLATGIINNLPSYNRQTVNTIPFMNTTTPAGSKWRARYTTSFTSWYDFFTSPTLSCTPQTYCNPATNNVTHVNSDCSYATPVYCGVCGCNAGLTGCNYPSVIGTYCDLSDTGHQGIITNLLDCSSKYNVCPSGSVCSQLTPKLTFPNDTILENYTPCVNYSAYTSLIGCVNFCPLQNLIDQPLWSNCRSECQHCDKTKLPDSSYSPYDIFVTQQQAGNIFPVQSYTATCINLTTGTEVESYDQNGNQTTIANIVNNATGGAYGTGNGTVDQTPSYTTNAFGWASLQFGSLFGMGGIDNLPLAEAGFSIVLSLLAGLSIMVYEHDKSEHGGVFANISFLAVFLLCAIMSSNAILYGLFVVIVILDVGMVTGMLKKLIGGG